MMLLNVRSIISNTTPPLRCCYVSSTRERPSWRPCRLASRVFRNSSFGELRSRPRSLSVRSVSRTRPPLLPLPLLHPLTFVGADGAHERGRSVPIRGRPGADQLRTTGTALIWTLDFGRKEKGKEVVGMKEGDAESKSRRERWTR